MGQLGFNWGKKRDKKKDDDKWNKSYNSRYGYSYYDDWDDDEDTDKGYTPKKSSNYYDVTSRSKSYGSRGYSYGYNSFWSSRSSSVKDPTQYISPKYTDPSVRLISFNTMVFLESLVQVSLMKKMSDASGKLQKEIKQNNYAKYYMSRDFQSLQRTQGNIAKQIREGSSGLFREDGRVWNSNMSEFVNRMSLWSIIELELGDYNRNGGYYGSSTNNSQLSYALTSNDELKGSILNVAVDLFKAYYMSSADLFIDNEANPQKARLLENSLNSLMKNLTVNKIYVAYSISALYSKYIYTMLAKFLKAVGDQNVYPRVTAETMYAIMKDLLVSEKTKFGVGSKEQQIQKAFVDFFNQEMAKEETQQQLQQEAQAALKAGQGAQDQAENEGQACNLDAVEGKGQGQGQDGEGQGESEDGDTAAGKQAGTGHDVAGRTYMDAIIDIQKSDVSSFLTESLDFVNDSVTKIYEVQEVGILDADAIEELDDLEMIMPQLRNVFIDQLTTQEREYYFKVNVYIDVSGSMQESTPLGGSTTDLLSIAKSLAIQLKRLNLLHHVYFFDGKVYTGIDNSGDLTEQQIREFSKSGGTSFEKVFSHWKREGKMASIVITDGEDHLSKYDAGLHWIGIDSALGGINDKYKEAGVAAMYSTESQKFTVLT